MTATMRCAVVREHGGLDKLVDRGTADSEAGRRPGAAARARRGHEPPRHLGAPRRAGTHVPAADDPRLRLRGRRRARRIRRPQREAGRRGVRRARPLVRRVRAVPRGRGQPLQGLRHLRRDARRRLRRVRGRPGGEPLAEARVDDVRGGGGVAARVPHRVAHARRARARSSPARRCSSTRPAAASAARRSRSRSSGAPR